MGGRKIAEALESIGAHKGVEEVFEAAVVVDCELKCLEIEPRRLRFSDHLKWRHWPTLSQCGESLSLL